MASSADRLVTVCRICGHSLSVYLSLGVQPLANAFLPAAELQQEFIAPLEVALCEGCGLSQLTRVVSPERLYRHYVYASGVSRDWRAHCAKLAQDYTRLYGGKKFVLEIAANDGSLLQAFQEQGHRVLGVEPADVPYPDAIPMVKAFWNSTQAALIRHEHGEADLIVATNVLGHVDQVVDFLDGIRLALAPWGMAIIECPHILPLLGHNAFDTIYHEHLSYWSLRPLQRACREAHLNVFDCLPQDVHGGTMRYLLGHVAKARVTDNVVGLWKRELAMDLDTLSPYEQFARRVRDLKHQLQQAFHRKGLYGFGASAKGNTLLNYIGATLPAIYDESPLKQGLVTPGQHIPVIPLPEDLSDVEAIVLLAWNWVRESKAKTRERGFKGEWLTPIPKPRWELA